VHGLTLVLSAHAELDVDSAGNVVISVGSDALPTILSCVPQPQRTRFQSKLIAGPTMPHHPEHHLALARHQIDQLVFGTGSMAG
jgi:hypothetical protein